MPLSFEVTWDYLCPFARNAHEHLVTALAAGAEWDVRFRYFSLAQAHLSAGSPAVWEEPAAHVGVLAGLAGLVVRERHPDQFLHAHKALFAARHDLGMDLRNKDVLVKALDAAGLDGADIVAQAGSGWPAELARAEHQEAVQRWEVFGVPTFIVGERAVFVRLMTRPEGNPKVAEATVDRLLELLDGFGELNEYKFTRIPR
jgi:protein-disulfide isomerase-like protein with CxxC motif